MNLALRDTASALQCRSAGVGAWRPSTTDPKSTLALVLAGGRGSRLADLIQHVRRTW